MLSRSRTLWLILLLLCAAGAPRAFDLLAPADGWEQLDDARLEAIPATGLILSAPAPVERQVSERDFALPARIAEAEIFRPPIG